MRLSGFDLNALRIWLDVLLKKDRKEQGCNQTIFIELIYYFPVRFGIAENQVTSLLGQGLPVLAKTLKFLIVWPDKDAIIRNMPKAFKHSRTYRNIRVIIDCSEVFIKRPSNLLAQNITYSNYKHHNTLKFLIGITPAGALSFLSKCWGGSVSDKELTLNSGFLDQLEYDDQVPQCKIINIIYSLMDATFSLFFFLFRRLWQTVVS